MSSSDGPEGADLPRREGAPGAGAGPSQASLLELARAFREFKVHMAEKVDGLARRMDQIVADHRDWAAFVAEVFPHVERIGAELDAGVPVGDAVGGPEHLSAARWSAKSAEDTRRGWRVLGDWVERVLCGEYRLSRAQLPDCWPVHPRAVRELVALHDVHLLLLQGPPAAPEQEAEFHTRWLPAALHNLTVAIDERECAPGRHRLTEFELETFARERADERHGTEGPLADDVRIGGEVGADRPRWFPSKMPSPRDRRAEHGAASSSRRAVPPGLGKDTPAPASTRGDWQAYWLDAQQAEVSAKQDRRGTAEGA